MQRIKYEGLPSCRMTTIYNIYGQIVRVRIEKQRSWYRVVITNTITCKSYEDRRISFQNAKRLVRKILKEEFEVNLGEEVRSKLCI